MTLQKRVRRSIGKNISFYLTGTVLTAITIMLLVGAFAVSNTLYDRFERFFAQNRIEDGEFKTETPLTDADIRALEGQYEVVLEQQHYTDLTYQDTKLRIFTQMEKLDLASVLEGEDLQSDTDIMVTYRYAKANGIAVGDEITILGQKFHVSGLCNKSDYAIMLYDLTESMPDQDGFGIGIITKQAMEKLVDPITYYAVRYEDKAKEQDFRKAVYDTYKTTEYIEKESNTRISLIFHEADDLTAEFSLYSPIIMLLVVVIIAMVLSRMVKREGKIIAVLMTLGYRKQELIRHYMLFGMIPAIGGDILGILCSIPFSKAFCGFYFGDGEYLDYTVKMPWLTLLVAVLIPVVVYGLVSYLVLSACLKSDIVPLLREQKKEKTARICRNSNRSTGWIYTVRSIWLNKARSLTMVIGIAVATLVVVLGGSFQDSYDNLIEVKMPDAMMGGQYEYGFKSFQTENPYGGSAVFDISFGAKVDDSRFNMIGYEEENDVLSAKLCSGKPIEYGKYYMTNAAAKRYHISPGDSFTFYDTVTLQETTIEITDILDNDVMALVLTSKENVAKLLDRPVEQYNVIISREKLDIPGEMLSKSASVADYIEQAKNLASTAGIVLKLLKVLGALICILVTSMLAGMILEENKRNVSMLAILGYTDREIRTFIFRANYILVPLGFLLGVPLGYATAYSMILSAMQSSGRLMSLPVKASTIGISFGYVLLSYLLAMLLLSRKKALLKLLWQKDE